jgi:hypothetical protein
MKQGIKGDVEINIVNNRKNQPYIYLEYYHPLFRAGHPKIIDLLVEIHKD